MIDLTKIDELAARLSEALPPGAQQLREEMEARFRVMLSRAFEKMDLVTREEFDIQKAVLERAMIKLESLQAQLESVEEGASGNRSG